MGLRIMQYRAALLGATLSIRPAEGRGTRVVCTVNGGPMDV
jgi:nitrate/nitrite-specific signal transduction histidine kinase